MLGAIVGDLAAWTYENDRDCFYSSLTSKDAVLSDLGKTALETALWSLDRRQNDCIELGIEPPFNPTGYDDRLVQLATLAWSNENPQSLIKSEKEIFYDDKEGMYAGNIIIELIQSLHIGKSKKEALSGHFGKIFYQMKAGWKWKESSPSDGLLTYLMKAWYCFETAWDFTSSIHNAAQWNNVDRHLLCSLTGAIAEAMYGCEYRFLKSKYGNNWYNFIEYPESIKESVMQIKEYQFNTRYFFPKNSALTNVERHIWTPYRSDFEDKRFTEDEYRKHLRSSYTGWENRFGLYLDDGWVYVYRSSHLIARFRYVQEDRCYIIRDVQHSEERPDFTDIAIQEALKGEPEYK
ncbi:MAG: hypothetical protein ACI3ZS_01840 [Candidatus Cryptobacteroides sp.]